MTRASILVERLGIPTVTLCCDAFYTPGRFTAAGEGFPNLPFAQHPGHVNVTPDEQVFENAVNIMTEQVVKGLTVQPKDGKAKREPDLRDIIFSGTYEEINEYFLENEWSEGLPIVPPTIEKVEQFLKFTDHAPDEVIGVLKPDNRLATVWNVAVNGVMCGCRPEYMPVLLAIAQVMCDPYLGQEHFGHTPGTECMIIVSGRKIIEDLKFNCTQGALRPGFQANTSIGRFWRMYLRNVAGLLPHKSDKGCFGDNFRIVLCENGEYLDKIGWKTYQEEKGFNRDDNIVTVMSCTERTQGIEVGYPTAEGILRSIELRMADNHMFIQFFFRGQHVMPLIVLTPTIIDSMVREGMTKDDVKRHLFEHARFRLSNLGGRLAERFGLGVKAGNWPQFIGTEEDYGPYMDIKGVHEDNSHLEGKKHFLVNKYGALEFYDENGNYSDGGEERFIQMLADPDDIQLIISGDPGRDHMIIGAENGFMGWPTSRKIELPADWDEKLDEIRKD